ncbi:MAG: transglutaminase domain-containing protein [Desulfobacterales bacterium]|nr:transglutaminase domain-containing protein [Desulfobacterales bacterium]
MKTPPFLISATLLFWGWCIDLLIISAILALIAESPRFIKTRWNLSLSDFSRIADVCTVACAGIIIYAYATNIDKAVHMVSGWLPLFLFPILAAQEYSAKGEIDLRALLLLARKNKGGVKKPPRFINASFPYFIICLISAGSANIRSGVYYICLVALFAWALWSARSKRYSPVVWILLLAMTGLCGYAGHIRLARLQDEVVRMTSEFFLGDSDPFRSATSIGDIGELKLSDRIVFRVAPGEERFQSILVREASYNSYRSTTWRAALTYFKEASPEKNGATWRLNTNPGEGKSITVSSYLKSGRGMLKLPGGAFMLENLPVGILEKNALGAVRVGDGPGLISCKIRYNPGNTFDSPPGRNDLVIPKKEKPALEKMMRELNLTSKQPVEILAAVEAFFQKFQYSLHLEGGSAGGTPLSNFLLESRAGHCEYFASAATLLLRMAGIPARYATGYSVHEFSELENMYIVRARHAHAWTLVYLNGAWRDFDATTSSWMDVEAEKASSFAFLQDFWAYLSFNFSRLWQKRGEFKGYAAWLIVPLAIILIRRLRGGERIKRLMKKEDGKRKKASPPRPDSDFYLIENRLAELGFERRPWETPRSWLERIQKSAPSLLEAKRLLPALHLHYRRRFSPDGLDAEEKANLKSRVEDALQSLQ